MALPHDVFTLGQFRSLRVVPVWGFDCACLPLERRHGVFGFLGGADYYGDAVGPAGRHRYHDERHVDQSADSICGEWHVVAPDYVAGANARAGRAQWEFEDQHLWQLVASRWAGFPRR